MQTDAVLSYSRIMAIEEFQQVLEKAQAGFLFRRLLSKDGGLESFRTLLPDLEPARHYRGMMEIPVGRIVGSVDRGADFDRDFRPLAPHLRDRWISVYLLAGEAGWPPIRALKAGDELLRRRRAQPRLRRPPVRDADDPGRGVGILVQTADGQSGLVLPQLLRPAVGGVLTPPFPPQIRRDDDPPLTNVACGFGEG